MKYLKPPLSFSDQADLIIGRGLVVANKADLVAKLEAVSYYRLSAYWYPFRLPGDILKPGTTLDMVWRRYTLDRQLRVLVMDAVERVEIAVRTQLVNRHTLTYGAYGYLDRANLPGISVPDHRQMLDRIHNDTSHSREDFVRHYFAKYTSETELPLWMACELMTFGCMLTMFRGIETPMKQAIGAVYGVSDAVLESWLQAFNQVRNLCAHHARLWNRIFGVKPLIPRPHKHPEWHRPVAIPNDRLFGILTVLHFMLKQTAPKTRWKERLKELFAEYHDIPLYTMGFPANFEDSPLWQ